MWVSNPAAWSLKMDDESKNKCFSTYNQLSTNDRMPFETVKSRNSANDVYGGTDMRAYIIIYLKPVLTSLYQGF